MKSRQWNAVGLLVALLLVGAALFACAPAKPAPSLVGEWASPDTAGKTASLSDLTLKADGQFRYAGKSALGGPVAFGGTYQTGVEAGTPWIRLIYADFPDAPQLWYYKLEEKQMLVSAVKGNLENGSALVFTRK
jgi:hypothetical protein